ncbi:MAG: IclR family transcriptional regulator [Synergistales bacterium]|nr:IclR family transcriptional regulator [Synergistales bacterium]
MNSTEKITWILKRLGEPPYEMGLSELAKEMGYGRSGIFKILGVLLSENFVNQDPETRKYSLGPVLFRLGNIYKTEKNLLEIAEPVMRELLEISGESVGLCIREGDNAVLAHQIVSDQPLRFEGKVGTRLAPNRGAQGKLMTAYEPDERIRDVLASTRFDKRTPYTLTEPDELLHEYEKIRSRGYSLSDEESFPGIRAIAAPIKNRHGKVWASIAIAGPTVRLTDERIQELIPEVIQAAWKISEGFGYKE